MLLDVKQLTKTQHTPENLRFAPYGTLVCGLFTRTAVVVGWLLSQQHASVSQGRICSILRAATLR